MDDSIAITQNYVSPSNLIDVLRFLREKPDQISGLGDNEGSSCDDCCNYTAADLYADFIYKLKNAYTTAQLDVDKHIRESHAAKSSPNGFSNTNKDVRNHLGSKHGVDNTAALVSDCETNTSVSSSQGAKKRKFPSITNCSTAGEPDYTSSMTVACENGFLFNFFKVD